MAIEQEINKIAKNFDSLLKSFSVKERKKIFRKAARPMVKEIRAQAPKGVDEHKRYSTAKIAKGRRAPKGSGTVVATYEPGNLSRAIGILPFRKSPNIFIGPKIKKGNSTGNFSGRKVDGYYAHWQEYGTVNFAANPYIRPGFEATKGIVMKRIEMEMRKKVTEFGNKHVA